MKKAIWVAKLFDLGSQRDDSRGNWENFIEKMNLGESEMGFFQVPTRNWEIQNGEKLQ